MFKFFSLKPKREKVIPFDYPIVKLPEDRLTIRSINSVFPETPEMRMLPKIKIL